MYEFLQLLQRSLLPPHIVMKEHTDGLALGKLVRGLRLRGDEPCVLRAPRGHCQSIWPGLMDSDFLYQQLGVNALTLKHHGVTWECREAAL